MSTRSFLLVALSIVGASAQAQSSFGEVRALLGISRPVFGEHLADELLVKVRPDQRGYANLIFRRARLKIRGPLNKLGWQRLGLPRGLSVNSALSGLRGHASILGVQKSYVYRKEDVPNDPLFGNQYGARLMQLPLAWTLAPEAGAGTVIAIIDTGVQVTHPDLRDHIVPGYDFVQGDNDPSDADGHGTHVAGIAAAAGNNGIGIAGNAYNASIMPIRVLGNDGGNSFSLADAVVYAVDHGANVMNMSLGAYPDAPDQAMVDAVAYAKARNVLITASAGNNNTDNGSVYHYPSDIPDIICVGASTSSDTQASFSNYGTPVDVAAPGEGTYSTFPQGGYEYLSGTSMAAPQVAGLAALVLAYSGGTGSLSQPELRALIEDNCDPIGSWIQKGRVNALGAISAAPSPLTEIAIPLSFLPFEGEVSDATAETVRAVDGVGVTLRSVRKRGVGVYGSFVTEFAGTKIDESNVTRASFEVVAQTDRLATLQLFMWNDGLNRWTLVKTATGTGLPQSVDFTMTNAALRPYFTGGDLKLLVRSFTPARFASRVFGMTRVDHLGIVLSGRRAAPSGR